MLRLKRLLMGLDHPLLTLLVVDWRFALAILVLAATLLIGGTLPLKLWNRAPSGFGTEVRVSSLDLLQARSLARSARRAESRGDAEAAIRSWAAALSNDPCNDEIGIHYLKALLRSGGKDHSTKALQIALWFHGFSTNSEIRSLSIAAAEQNKNWFHVLRFADGQRSGERGSDSIALARVKGLFWTGNYQAAYVVASRKAASLAPAFQLYRDALTALVAPESDRYAARERLEGWLKKLQPTVEELEVFLTVSYELHDLSSFEAALETLRRRTDRTLACELLLVRLLSDFGLPGRARDMAARLPPPTSGYESYRTAETLLKLGQRSGAILTLRQHLDDFFDSFAPWLLYAQLLIEDRDQQGLREIVSRLQRSVSPLDAFTAAIKLHLDPSESALRNLNSCLAQMARDQNDSILLFTAQSFISAGYAHRGLEVLLSLEPNHRSDVTFYDRLFAAAEAARDADAMRHASERRYQLAPRDPISIANHAAMLAMFDEQPETAAELSARLAEVEPASAAAKINQAAALICGEKFGSADLILRQIDETGIPPKARTQLGFIKLKRAVKLGLHSEARALLARLDRNALYSRQVEWLTKQDF